MKTAEKSRASGVSAMANSEDLAKQTRTWGMLLHLSLIVPLLGLVAPIVIWQLKKEEVPGIDQHGKNAANWVISEFICLVVGYALAYVVGSLPLLAVYVVGIVFCVLAGIKANQGETWKYPMAYEFIK